MTKISEQFTTKNENFNIVFDLEYYDEGSNVENLQIASSGETEIPDAIEYTYMDKANRICKRIKAKKNGETINGVEPLKEEPFLAIAKFIEDYIEQNKP